MITGGFGASIDLKSGKVDSWAFRAGVKPYPQWICSDCGFKHGRKDFVRAATWHADICGVCGERKSCTEPRDFGHLKEGWDK